MSHFDSEVVAFGRPSELEAAVLAYVIPKLGDDMLIKRKDVIGFIETNSSWYKVKRIFTKRARHGRYDLSVPVAAYKRYIGEVPAPAPAVEAAAPVPSPAAEPVTENVIPMNRDPVAAAVSGKTVASSPDWTVDVPKAAKEFVPWGHYDDIKMIIESRKFFPIYVQGLSGNGKTFACQQACAEAYRGLIRVQISQETDEDDLIGGLRLINGDTVFVKGPVLRAMEAGEAVLLDEIDRGTNKLLCLQGILEGSPYFIKKTGETIYPKKGFTIVATANTKGRGSSSGHFTAAMMLDEAFLERFKLTFNQPYPDKAIERKIVGNHFEKYCDGNRHAKKTSALVKWADQIRSLALDEMSDIEDFISTRRLCVIAESFAIFGNLRKCVELAIERFDEEFKDAALDMFDSLYVEEEDVAAQDSPGATTDSLEGYAVDSEAASADNDDEESDDFPF